MDALIPLPRPTCRISRVSDSEIKNSRHMMTVSAHEISAVFTLRNDRSRITGIMLAKPTWSSVKSVLGLRGRGHTKRTWLWTRGTIKITIRQPRSHPKPLCTPIETRGYRDGTGKLQKCRSLDMAEMKPAFRTRMRAVVSRERLSRTSDFELPDGSG